MDPHPRTRILHSAQLALADPSPNSFAITRSRAGHTTAIDPEAIRRRWKRLAKFTRG